MGHPAPYRIMLTMKILPGRDREFEETWLTVGDRISRHPANLGQWFVRSQDEASTYFVVSDWTDEESFREYERSPKHEEHRKTLQPLLAGVAMLTGTVLTYLTGAGA
jgi:heme-degrading monooxygenase HmoA